MLIAERTQTSGRVRLSRSVTGLADGPRPCRKIKCCSGSRTSSKFAASGEAKPEDLQSDRGGQFFCQALDQPWIATHQSTAHRGRGGCRESCLSMLRQCFASDRRGRRRAARHRAGAVPRLGRAPAQICLLIMRERGGTEFPRRTDRPKAADYAAESRWRNQPAVVIKPENSSLRRSNVGSHCNDARTLLVAE